jgi:hypothetical protein
MRISSATKEDQSYYTWTLNENSHRMISAGYYSSEMFNQRMAPANEKNRGITSKSVAGSGIYISKNPYDSSQYGERADTFFKDSPAYKSLGAIARAQGYLKEGQKPGLVQVTVQKGTPVIDLTDHRVLEKLKAEGIDKNDVFALNPPLIVRYSEGEPTWYVVKTNKGISFEYLNDNNSSFATLKSYSTEMRGKLTKKHYADRLKALTWIKNQSQGCQNEIKDINQFYRFYAKKENVNVEDCLNDKNFPIAAKALSLVKTLEDGLKVQAVKYDKLLNDEVTGPYMTICGKKFLIDEFSDPNGICKAIGLKVAKNVSYTQKGILDSKYHVTVSPSGLPLNPSVGQTKKYIKSIKCN